MLQIEVFDPPMCCSSGVCGTDPNPMLSQFAADLDWLRQQGVAVRRYNLAQEPAAFTGNPQIKRLMDESEGDALPVITVDGQVVTQRIYPDRGQLAQLAGVATDAPKHSLNVQAQGECCGGSDCC